MFLHMNIRTFVTILSRKAQCNFPKMKTKFKGDVLYVTGGDNGSAQDMDEVLKDI